VVRLTIAIRAHVFGVDVLLGERECKPGRRGPGHPPRRVQILKPEAEAAEVQGVEFGGGRLKRGSPARRDADRRGGRTSRAWTSRHHVLVGELREDRSARGDEVQLVDQRSGEVEILVHRGARGAPRVFSSFAPRITQPRGHDLVRLLAELPLIAKKSGAARAS
jgi:hypothetical protein